MVFDGVSPPKPMLLRVKSQQGAADPPDLLHLSGASLCAALRPTPHDLKVYRGPPATLAMLGVCSAAGTKGGAHLGPKHIE